MNPRWTDSAVRTESDHAGLPARDPLRQAFDPAPGARRLQQQTGPLHGGEFSLRRFHKSLRIDLLRNRAAA